jgi:3-isopropylmalate dehydrogenase
MHASLCILPGDGIGPEVTAQAVRVLERVAERFGHQFDFEQALIGGCAIDATNGQTALPDETLDCARRSDAVLLGAVGGPRWDNPKATVRPEQGLLAIRKALDLFANLRPIKLSPMLIKSSTIKPEVLEGTDLLVVRELTGGIYFGEPRVEGNQPAGQRAAIDTLTYSEAEIVRILRVGFELAQARRKKLTSVDKANILASSRLWRSLAEEVKADYPDVQLEHVLVDAMAMHLIRTPARFDVVVTENLFGDILTDEASMLTGSMGMLPSASLGAQQPGKATRMGLYEPIHGSAPDIAGQGKANPCATILSAAMLLRHSLRLEQEAAAVEHAVEAALDQGYRTGDIMEPGATPATTEQMGSAILSQLF